VRSRTAMVMTKLMRNGRDRRSENPSGPTRYSSAGDCPGPISGSHQGQRPPWLHRDRGNPPSDNRPYTWLHPNASQKSQIPLAPRAPSIMARSDRYCAATKCRLVRPNRKLQTPVRNDVDDPSRNWSVHRSGRENVVFCGGRGAISRYRDHQANLHGTSMSRLSRRSRSSAAGHSSHRRLSGAGS
jgi:hypothetical protein